VKELFRRRDVRAETEVRVFKCHKAQQVRRQRVGSISSSFGIGSLGDRVGSYWGHFRAIREFLGSAIENIVGVREV
jgi:hypothetical protein